MLIKKRSFLTSCVFRSVHVVQMLMHEKTKTALVLWQTDIPSLTKPLLVGPRRPRHPQSPAGALRRGKDAGHDPEQDVASSLPSPRCQRHSQGISGQRGTSRPIPPTRHSVLLHEVSISPSHPSSSPLSAAERVRHHEIGVTVQVVGTRSAGDCVRCQEELAVMSVRSELQHHATSVESCIA